MNIKSIFAVSLRQFYLYRRSMTRLFEVFYWPMVDLLLWGFVTVYLQKSSTGLPQFVSFFLGALILWDILFRSQQGIAVSFLEDMWARNLINIFVSPIRISEYIYGLLLISIFKVIVAFSVLSLLAGLLYSFDIFKIGISLIPLILNLMATGWAIGIFTVAIILRFGQQTEILAWAVAFLFMPFSAVFYPVDVLPPVLQYIAKFIPPAYVFEGMRSVIASNAFPLKHIIWASVINIIYITCSVVFLTSIYKSVLQRGIIPKVGE